MKQSKYFSLEETKCKCGCGINNISPIFLFFLDRLREKFGYRMVLTSACRCPNWNKKVGGKPKSAHISTEEIECVAVDVEMLDSTARDMFLWCIYNLTFQGKRIFPRIGIAKNFVHLDISNQLPNMKTWVY